MFNVYQRALQPLRNLRSKACLEKYATAQHILCIINQSSFSTYNSGLRSMSIEMGTEVCSVDVSALRSELFTLKDASPFYFRFLHCQSFVEHNLLRILGFS